MSESVLTHCPYCALQCGARLSRTGAGVTVSSSNVPVDGGGLCHKGWTAPALLDVPDRLRSPLLRDVDGDLYPADWDAALDRVAAQLRRIRAEHGPDAVAVFGGGGLTNEKAYLLGKFARLALGTSQIDYNGRFCMSSAAVTYARVVLDADGQTVLGGVLVGDTGGYAALRSYLGRQLPGSVEQLLKPFRVEAAADVPQTSASEENGRQLRIQAF